MNDDTRLALLKRSKGRCEVCGKPFYLPESVFQLAHIVKQSKYNLKRYGKEIIHHPANMKAVCSLVCNSKADMGFADEKIRKHIDKIIILISEKEKQSIDL